MALWDGVRKELSKDSSSVGSLAIIRLIEEQCAGDYECLTKSYELTTSRLQRRNLFLLAIPLAETWWDLAANADDHEEAALAVESLQVFYNFTNQAEKARDTKIELAKLYGLTGNIDRKLMHEAMLEEGYAWYEGDAPTAIAGIKRIRQEALEKGLNRTADDLLIRLKYIYEEFGYWNELEELIIQFEQIVKESDNPHPAYIFHATAGRGDLLRQQGKLGLAADKYQEILRYIRANSQGSHDTWNELYLLHRLARLEWERGNMAVAERYLDTTYHLADTYDMHDRILITQSLRIEMAEASGRYQDALLALREQLRRQNILDSIAAGFDLKRHELELGMQKLTNAQQRQNLDLQLRNTQLRTTLIVAGLVLLLCLLLGWGFWYQRSARVKLSERNEVISEQTRQLQQLDAAKSRFFANISHELRTPLTLMLGPMQSLLAQSSRLPEKERKLVNIAARGGENLRRLVNEIFNLTKLDAGKLECDFTPTQPTEFFSLYLSQFESLADRKMVNYQFRVDAPQSIMIQLDREKMRQILSNLLSNAFKFTEPGDTITATITVCDGQLQMEVSDSGRGIHPDDLSHVFDRFFQTQQTDVAAAGGTGIGLSLCAQYVKLLGGTIEVASALNSGARFTVKLPAIIATEPISLTERNNGVGTAVETISDSVPAAEGSYTTSVSQPNLLIVEDSPDLQQYLLAILSNDYNCQVAENGAEAWKTLAASTSKIEKIDLVISDLMMPIMDGYQLLEKVKSESTTQHLPFVMLTARAEREDRLKALRVGVDDYLGKPFDEEELKVRIKNLLNNQRVRQQMLQSTQAKIERPVLSVPDREWLESFESFVRDHLSDSRLSVNFLIDEFAMSESTLLRQLKRLTGLTPMKYIQEMRLATARDFLTQRRYNSVSRIGAEVGYADVRSFSRSYRKRFGRLPSDLLV